MWRERARVILGVVLAGVGSLPACGGGGGDGAESTAPAPPCSVGATVATTGVELDPDGYTLTLGASQSQSVSINGTATFASVAAGAYDLALSGIAVSCTSSATSNPRRYGGIHFVEADMQSRAMGRLIGAQVWAKARTYFDGG